MNIEQSVIKYPSGEIQAREWLYKGKPHREDGPAWIEYFKNGKVQVERWCLNGLPHREDGPAEITYYSNGQLWHQSWTIKGKYHRVVFPSYITYNRNGVGEEFYWSNQNNNLTDQVIQYLKENGLRDPLNIPVDHQIIMKMKFW